MRALTSRVVCLGLGLYVTAAAAQFDPAATAALGAGYGRIALTQSMLSGTQLVGKRAGPARGTAGAGTSQPAAEAALTYTSDPKLTERIHTSMVDAMTQNNPALRPQLEQALAPGRLLKNFDHFMSVNGFSSHDVADDMTMLLLVSWEIATDGKATKSQIRGAGRQVHGALLHAPRMSALSNAQRQEMGERIAYQIFLGSAAKGEFQRSGDRAQLALLRELAGSVLRQQGIDLRSLRLTDQGFTH